MDKILILLLIFSASVGLINLILSFNLSLIITVVTILLSLYLMAYLLKKLYPDAEEIFPGMLMIRTTKFNSEIEKFSYLYDAIRSLSKIIFYFLFGILAFVFDKWNNLKNKLILWITSLGLMIFSGFLYSYGINLLFGRTLSTSNIDSSLATISILFGVLGIYIISSLAVIYNSIIKIASGAKISNTIMPLIPGITIPLFESVLALIITLIVHELAHAVLAVVNNVNVRNTGIVLFGGIPIGAFVEPDQDQLDKLDAKSKIEIIAAGNGINLFMSLIFFSLGMIIFLINLPLVDLNNCYTIIDNQTYIIYKIDGKSCNTFITNQSIAETNKGNISLEGKVVFPMNVLIYSLNENAISDPLIRSIYRIVMIIAILNLILAIANLFPIIFFDGAYIVLTTLDNIKKYTIAKIIVLFGTSLFLTIIVINLIFSR